MENGQPDDYNSERLEQELLRTEVVQPDQDSVPASAQAPNQYYVSEEHEDKAKLGVSWIHTVSPGEG